MSTKKGIVLNHKVQLKGREGAPYEVHDISEEAFRRFLNWVEEKSWRFFLVWPCVLVTIQTKNYDSLEDSDSPENSDSPVTVHVTVPTSTDDDKPIGLFMRGDADEVSGSLTVGEISFEFLNEVELAFSAEGREGLVLHVRRKWQEQTSPVQISLVWRQPDGREIEVVRATADESDVHAQVVELPEGIGPREGVAGFGVLLGKCLRRTWEQDDRRICMVLYFAAQELWLSKVLTGEDDGGEEE